MSTKIILKKSNTPGSIPLTSDLLQGELAVNTADRKLYTNNGAAIVSLGVYVAPTAPSSPVEGDLWYDTTADTLKVYNGSAWGSSAPSAAALSDLTDVVITTIAAGELLKWNGTDWVNNTLAEAGIQPAGSYLTAEVDTLATVTARGATTTADVTVGGLVVSGNLTVNGTTTTVNSNTVAIGDSIIVLNVDEVGTPSQNSGIEVERGTSANVSFLWDETADVWSLGNQTLADVVLDGGTY